MTVARRPQATLRTPTTRWPATVQRAVGGDRDISRDTKLRCVAKARLCAPETMSLTCTDGDRLPVTVIPRSRTEETVCSCGFTNVQKTALFYQ